MGIYIDLRFVSVYVEPPLITLYETTNRHGDLRFYIVSVNRSKPRKLNDTSISRFDPSKRIFVFLLPILKNLTYLIVVMFGVCGLVVYLTRKC